MRLARFDLIRFGKFADVTLDFPAAKSDFHVVYGPNEAGKSTLRAALLDLFYGMHLRTPYAYKYGHPAMEIGGLLERAEGSLDFRRTKKRPSLLTASGDPLTDEELAGWLAHTDRESFERMFAIDHAKLVAGEQSIIESGGDSGGILLQAAVGITNLHEIRKTMDAEGKDLWGLPRRKEALFSTAEDRFTRAKVTLTNVNLTASQWKAVDQAAKDAQAAEDAVQDEVNQLAIREKRLERVKRVATPLQRYREAVSFRAQLGTPALFADGADKTFAAAETASERAKIVRGLLDTTLTETKSKLDAIALAPEIIAQKSAIEDLAARLAVFRKAILDLPGVEQELEVLQDEVATAARHLGWTETDLGAVTAKVPSPLVRDDLASLLKREQGLLHALQTATTARDGKIASIDQLGTLIGGVSEQDLPPALIEALADARALNYAAAFIAARTTAQQAQRRQDEDFAALAPWQGNADELRVQNAPSLDEATRFTVQRSGLEALHGNVSTDLANKQTALDLARQQSEHHAGERELVSAEALQGQRRQRDHFWQTLRNGEKSLATDGDGYEQEVRTADTLADRRYDTADQIAKDRELRAAVGTLEIEVGALQRRVKELDDQLKALATAWEKRVAACGNFLSLDQYPAWFKAREAALTSARATTAAHAAQGALEERAREIAAALRAALTEAGDESAETSLAALTARADAAITAHNEARVRLAGWVEDCDGHRQQLPELELDVVGAQSALDEWRDERIALLRSAGLPETIGSAGAERALLLFAEIEQNNRHAAGLARRATAMQGEIKEFTTDAQALARGCAPELMPRAPAEIADVLDRRLREAEHAATEHQRLAETRDDTQRQINDNDRDEADAAAQLAPLLAAAKVETKDALRVAVAQWTACHDADAEVKKARDAVVNSGGGIPFATLETEVDDEDLTLIDTILVTVRGQLAEASARLKTAIETRTTAQAALAKYDGQDTAVRAEADKQNALLEMREAAEGHLRIALGARLLAWAVNRFAEKQHEPLLMRASAIFAKLTLGSFERLAIGHDDAMTPLLYAYRPDDSFVIVGRGLSTGTEAQLFLALRLAALHEQLDRTPPLPFLGDDLFLGFDKERCAAGIEVLADLATRTQVILLTHDEDIANLARKVAAGRVNVTELPRNDVEGIAASTASCPAPV